MPDDITPPHHPVSLLREALDRAEDAQACVVVLINKEGDPWYDTCGHSRHAVLWALESMRYQVMREAHGDD